MKKELILFLTICLISCSKDGIYEDSYGKKLISIEYENNNDNELENYYYSPDGKLTKIEDFRSTGYRYEFYYENSKLKEYRTTRINDEQPFYKDSIVYNANGTIKAIHHFSLYSDKKLQISEYDYNSDNQVIKKSIYSVTGQKFTGIEKYFWENCNIVRVENYSGDGKVFFSEEFYKYDDKNNYKKELPTSISQPIYWGKNNITEMDWKEYNIIIDAFCKPCYWEYKYNLDNYPVWAKFNGGNALIIKYE